MRKEKIGFLKLDSMGEYEKEKGWASYRTVIERYIGDIVLCNNIINIDSTVWDNMEPIQEEEKENNYIEIYQYYLCNISEYEKEQAIKAGLIISYSDLLDCDVLCVDHFGTSWDYVLTNVKLFDTYEELTQYEKEEE